MSEAKLPPRLYTESPERADAERGLQADDETVQLAHELDDVMGTLLPPLAPSADLLSRLQREIATPPLRYAPFFDRLAELFDLTVPAVIAQTERLADPHIWRFAGLPGVRNVIVPGGPRVQGAEVVFARFASGTRFPRHRHAGLERVLVLEGSYTDSLGIVHRAGELREWEPGSQHGFRVSESEVCIFASVVYGREFEALPLRLLARALGR
jgi:anti-sigma factor ChrR (cupin superfamily)